MSIPWIILSILVLIIILAIVAFKTKKKSPPDYYAFYTIGITWLIIGIPLKMYPLAAMGFIFAIVGIIHKDKWKANRQICSDKKKKVVLFLLLGLLVIAGLVIFYFNR